MNDTDSKQSAGYFKEKASIALSSLKGDDVDKAIMKATSHMLKAPKEKYVQSLVAASYGYVGEKLKNGRPMCDYIVVELEKRSHTHNWIIVLKSMVLLHRLMAEASDNMVTAIVSHQNVFTYSNVKNLSDTRDGAGQAFFIERYMKFLEVRCITMASLGKGRRFEIDEFEEYLRSLNVENLSNIFEVLLHLLEALVMVDYRENVVDNFCSLEVYNLVIRDGKRLYSLLSKRVVFVLDGFEEFSLPLKRLWYSIYLRFHCVVGLLKTFFDSMSRSSRVFSEPIPQLRELPETLLRRLDDDIKASERPVEEPCTLESLGIRSNDQEPPKPATGTQPATTTFRTTDYSPATKMAEELAPPLEPTPTPKPQVVIDDLFETSPTTAYPTVVPFASTGNGLFTENVLAKNVKPSESLTDHQNQWPHSSPAQWSSGAPEEWSCGAPPMMGTTSEPLLADTDPTEPVAVEPSQGTLQNILPAKVKKGKDPFQELFDETQKNFN